MRLVVALLAPSGGAVEQHFDLLTSGHASNH